MFRISYKASTCFVLFVFNLIAAFNSGQFFILTLPDTTKQKDLASWLEKTRPSGVMLTAGHVKKRADAKKLCAFLQNKAKKLGIYPLLICIDWEGGIVSRPNEAGGFHSIPSPHNLCMAGRTSCFLAGQLIGQQMLDIGINVDFAPSLDLFDPKNHTLATRCFSNDPDITYECGIAFANGLMSMGVIPVIKHYPGLMLGKSDTHFNNVKINAGNRDFSRNEKPFIKSIQSGLPAVMITHAIYSQLDKIPASRSSKVIKRLKKNNPELTVFTDDISMYAYNDGKNLETSAAQSINNGFDLLIYSAPLAQQINLIEKLNKQLKNKKRSSGATKIKKLITEQKQHVYLDEKQTSSRLAQQCLNQSIKFVDMQNKNIVLISVDLCKIRTTEKWFVKNERITQLVQLIKNQGINLNEIILNAQDPSSLDCLQNIVKSGQLNKTDLIVVQTFFYGDGKWNQVQEQWLKTLKAYAYKTILFSLGHPFEKLIITPRQILELGSFHMPILKTALDRLNTQSLITGANKLAQKPETYLSNKNFGLLCHRCSVVNNDNKIEFLPDFLYQWTKNNKHKAKLCALFAPEHGIFGTKEAYAKIDSQRKSKWVCPIYSLHGTTKHPTGKMLQNLDLLIIDLQEVGVRCYTYLSTLALSLKAAKENSIPVLLLERPNPIKFLGAHGPDLNPGFQSFVGKVDTQFIHGLTIGQIAKNLNQTIGAELTVLSCDFNEKSTAAYFMSNYIPPSPNLPTIDSIICYPLTVFIEGTNYSEGRGTLHPFEQIGAPWVDAKKLANSLNQKKLHGIYFEPVSFMPKNISGMAENPKHKNSLCHGVFLHIYDYKKLKPMTIAQTILNELFKSYPQKSSFIKFENEYFVDLLAGSDCIRLSVSSI